MPARHVARPWRCATLALLPGVAALLGFAQLAFADSGPGATPPVERVALAAVTVVNLDDGESFGVLRRVADRLEDAYVVEVVVARAVLPPECVSDEGCARRVGAAAPADAVIFFVVTRVADTLRVEAVACRRDGDCARDPPPAIEIDTDTIGRLSRDDVRPLLAGLGVAERRPDLAPPAEHDRPWRDRAPWLAAGGAAVTFGIGAGLAGSAARNESARRGRAAAGLFTLSAAATAAAAWLFRRRGDRDDDAAAHAGARLDINGARGPGRGVALLVDWTF